MRLGANLSLLFQGSLADRYAAAARAGFAFAEVQFPYSESVQAFAAAAQASGLPTALINAPAGDLAAGDRGLAGDPARRQAFRDSLERAMEYAAAVDCRLVHVMVGNGDTAPAASPLVIENLREAADRFAGAGITVILEGLNRVDNPAYAMSTLEQAEALRLAVGRPNVALMGDSYHLEMVGGRALERMLPLLDRIGHVQIAGAPGRREPDTGALDIHGFLAAIEAAGYAGRVACEYVPSNPARPDFGWAGRYGLTSA